MLKSHILLGDEEMLSSFFDAYRAVQKFTLRDVRYTYTRYNIS